MTDNDLPEGVAEWVAEVGGGQITRLERHVANREAWVVDVTQADGSVTEGFLRLERERLPDDPWSFGKETRIVATLADTAVPVPAVLGRNERLSATLFERVAGRSDLPAAGPASNVRSCRTSSGSWPSCTASIPATSDSDGLADRASAECALGEVDLILDRWKDFLAGLPRPAHHLRGELAAPQRPGQRSLGCRSSRETPVRSTSSSTATGSPRSSTGSGVISAIPWRIWATSASASSGTPRAA